MTRTLAISDDVYEMVSKAQMEGESVSDVIRRVLRLLLHTLIVLERRLPK